MALRSLADGALFAETFGDEPPRVLALHGWGRRGSDFKKCLAGVPGIALDLPGFGSSPPPSGVVGAEGYADIVAEVLGEFDEPPVLVGHSFGGRVAVCLAAKHPDRVGPLLLTGVPLMRRVPVAKPALGFRIVRSLNRIGIVSDERMEVEKRRRGSADYRAATGVMRDILVRVVNEEYPDQLRSIRSEVSLLWGERDADVPVEIALRAREILEETGGPVAIEILEGVGHHVPLEAPDELRRVIDSLLT